MSLLLSSWEWKMEPASPELDISEDVWLIEDEPSSSEEEGERPTRAQAAAKLLDDLEIDQWVKEEPFSDWLEEKIDLPIYEEIPPMDACRPKPTKPTPPPSSTLDTDFLLHEFECIYGEVGLHNGALTPPQSPPRSPVTLHELAPAPAAFRFANPMSARPGAVAVGSNVDDLLLLDAPPPTPQPDVESELAAVDELLRTRAADMDVSSDPWESESSSVYSSPASCSSPASSDGGPDPEWMPSPVAAAAPGKATSAAKRKRGKPYGRPVEDKKLRKKEQNKNAATRYRQKKRQEVEVILDEEKGLEDVNTGLHDKVTDLQREIKYLKGLMRDLFKARGLLK